jgi:hypothetical protein
MRRVYPNCGLYMARRSARPRQATTTSSKRATGWPFLAGARLLQSETIPHVQLPDAPGQMRHAAEDAAQAWDDDSEPFQRPATSPISCAVEGSGTSDGQHLTIASSVGTTSGLNCSYFV